MKRHFMFRLFMGLLFITLGNNSFAQQQEAQPVSVNPNVVKAFEHTFKNAVNPAWYEVKGKFLVKFTKEDLTHHALYSKKGRLIYNITFGSQNSLPSDVKKLVTQNYYDYNIVHATNIKDDNRNVWEIKLEGSNKLISIFVENEQIQEVAQYQKAI